MQLAGVCQEQSGPVGGPQSVGGGAVGGMICACQQATAGTLLHGEVSARFGELELPPATPLWPPSGLRKHIHAPLCGWKATGQLSCFQSPWLCQGLSKDRAWCVCCRMATAFVGAALRSG